MLKTLFGTAVDGFFQGIGASPLLVRYRNSVVISPTPIISDEGVQTINESSRLSQSEGASTYSVSIPWNVLDTNLAQATESPVSNFKRDVAIAPNQPWWISADNGKSWRLYRTLGDAEIEAFRVKLTLVAAK